MRKGQDAVLDPAHVPGAILRRVQVMNDTSKAGMPRGPWGSFGRADTGCPGMNCGTVYGHRFSPHSFRPQLAFMFHNLITLGEELLGDCDETAEYVKLVGRQFDVPVEGGLRGCSRIHTSSGACRVRPASRYALRGIEPVGDPHGQCELTESRLSTRRQGVKPSVVSTAA